MAGMFKRAWGWITALPARQDQWVEWPDDSPAEAVDAAIDDWTDVIQFHRQTRAHGSGWTCTLHMPDGENIIIGAGRTRREAALEALRETKLRV